MLHASKQRRGPAAKLPFAARCCDCWASSTARATCIFIGGVRKMRSVIITGLRRPIELELQQQRAAPKRGSVTRV